MGEPMCRNLASKSGKPVIGFDRVDAPLERLAGVGVKRAVSLAELAKQADVIFLGAARAESMCRRYVMVMTVCSDMPRRGTPSLISAPLR